MSGRQSFFHNEGKNSANEAASMLSRKMDWSATVPVADRAKMQAGRLRSSRTLLEWL